MLKRFDMDNNEPDKRCAEEIPCHGMNRNRGQRIEKDFEKNLNFMYIKEKARKEITKEIDSRLQTTIMHKTLKRDVSYEYLIRLEIYKLIKYLTEDIPYEGFKMWW